MRPRDLWSPRHETRGYARDVRNDPRDDRRPDYAVRDDPYDRYEGDDRWTRDRNDYGQADYSNDYAYDPAQRTGYRQADQYQDRDDFGQVDYSDDYVYDPATRQGHRRGPDDQPYRNEPRSWFGRGERRDSDRVLWAAIASRLDNARGLDTSDIEIIVRHGEVTLNGTVRRREDKRRIEDLADVRGVRDVQNNLRIRERGGWARALGF